MEVIILRRKILYSLLFLCLLIIYFFTFNFFSSPEAITTFKQYSSPNYKLTTDMVHTYLNGDSDSASPIEHDIKMTILKVLGYQQWEEYVDYIELKMYLARISPASSPQLISVLNLSKDIGTVVIFEEVNNQYIYQNKLENIIRIKDIEFIKKQEYDYNMMVIYQVIDEYLGAFFYKEFLEIYLYNNDVFRNVWEQTIYFEEVYKEDWLFPNTNKDQWNKIIETTEINFDFSNSSSIINTYTEQTKYSALSESIPDKDNYSVEQKYNFEQSFYWSDNYNCFIMGEVTKDIFLKDMALIKDMNTSIEKLFGIENSNIKVISQNGDVTYLNKFRFLNFFNNH